MDLTSATSSVLVRSSNWGTEELTHCWRFLIGVTNARLVGTLLLFCFDNFVNTWRTCVWDVKTVQSPNRMIGIYGDRIYLLLVPELRFPDPNKTKKSNKDSNSWSANTIFTDLESNTRHFQSLPALKQYHQGRFRNLRGFCYRILRNIHEGKKYLSKVWVMTLAL